MGAAPRITRVFHISPEWCGQERLTQLFRLNGYRALCDDTGAVARDITFSQATGRAALNRWPRICLFTGLFGTQPPWQPPLECWRHFAWLARSFPRAAFILTQRDPQAWALDRLTRDGGVTARCHARHLGVDLDDLPAIWQADFQAHQSAVQAHFGDDPRLVCIDIDRETPADFCAKISALMPFNAAAKGRAWLPEADLGAQLASLTDAQQPETSPDAAKIARDIADFCLRGLSPDDTGTDAISRYSCHWDGGNLVRGRHGANLPIAISGAERGRIAVADLDVPFKQGRLAGVINDVLALGRNDAICADMEDSRWMGSADGNPLGAPVLCHNRREGARNVVLWPLPGQHNIGLPGFDPTAPADPISFEDKLDRVVWRGMISGNLVTGEARPGLPSFHFLNALEDAGTDPKARAEAWDKLSRTSRLAFVRDWIDHPDFDLGVVLAWRFRRFADDPLLAPYCRPRAGRDLMQRYRYQLYMAGYDHGSNFIGAIDSQSVLLKEEDGWEVFYSGRFKPWIHYIPLERYCADIAEKLVWARKNPSKCKEMSRAAREQAAHLRDPLIRRLALGHILDAIASKG